MEINGKKIEFKNSYTRAIDRWFNDCLFEWVKANTQNTNSIDIPLSNIQKANDYLVKNMTNLTDEEIDNLTSEDYNKILEKVQEIKTPSK